MPLSPDPEKRAKQIANLSRGGKAAGEKFGLPVVGYGDPPAKPATKPEPPRQTADNDGDDPGGAGVMVWLLAGAALLVLVMLSRPSAPA